MNQSRTSLPVPPIADYAGAMRGTALYRHITKERFRVPMHVLRNQYDQCGPDKSRSLFKVAQRFINTPQHPPVTVTRHMCERLDGYVNRPSRCKRYTELTQDECDLLKAFPWWWPRVRKDSDVVEVGLNDNKEICKVSCVLRLEYTPRRMYLFVCIGVDGGVKTMYVTPEYKERSVYKSSLRDINIVTSAEALDELLR